MCHRVSQVRGDLHQSLPERRNAIGYRLHGCQKTCIGTPASIVEGSQHQVADSYGERDPDG